MITSKKLLLAISMVMVATLILIGCGKNSPPPPAADGGIADGGTPDGGTEDGGVDDGGIADGGPADGGPADGGPADGGPADGGPADGGIEDGGVADGGPADGGPADGGPADGGPADGGPADGGIEDGGIADGGPADGGPADGGVDDGGIADGGPADGGTDDGGVDGGGLTTYTDGENHENSGERLNDTMQTAVPIRLPAQITGYIGNYDTTNNIEDIDYYKFSGTAGTYVKVTVSVSSSLIHPRLGYMGGKGSDFSNWSVYPFGQTLVKWIFLPENGDYYLYVHDYTNHTGSQVGGVNYPYTMDVELVSPITPTAIAFPSSPNISGALPSIGNLAVYSASLNSGTAYGMEIIAQGLGTPTNVNPILYIFNTTTGKLAWRNDDSGNTDSGGVLDSFASFIGASDYLFIVDAGPFVHPNTKDPLTNPDLGFQIKTLSSTATSTEIEPNDASLNPYKANPIAPGASTPMTIGGTINQEAPDGGGVARDQDWYIFYCLKGSYYKATVTRTGTSLNPHVKIYTMTGLDIQNGNYNGPILKAVAENNNGSEVTATTEFLCSSNGIYYAVVEDYRNTQSPTNFVGGATGYEYTLSIQSQSRTPISLGTLDTTALQQQGAVNGPGKTAWYSFQVSSPGLIELLSKGSSLKPMMTLYQPNGWERITSSPDLIAYMLTGGQTYWLGIKDLDGEGGATGYEFTIGASSPTPVTESADNNTYDKADSIPTLPGIAIGALDSGDEDWYSLNLTVGTVVTVMTNYGSSSDTAVDTKVAIHKATPTGSQELVSDDNSGPDSIFSKISNWSVPASGAYYIRVWGQSASVKGNYILAVKQGPCLPVAGTVAPTSSNLVINEYLPDPDIDIDGGTTGCDANGNGVVEYNKDEFVEIFNPSDDTVDLSGVQAVDRNGDNTEMYLRHRFACGTRLESKKALVILQSAPVLDGGTIDYSNILVQENNISAMGLDNSGDTFALFAHNAGLNWGTGGAAPSIALDGGIAALNPITSVDWSSSPTGTSTNLCQNANESNTSNCDQGTKWNEHWAVCSAASGCMNAFCSPGKSISGGSFIPTAGDVCGNAPVFTETTTFTGQTLSGYVDNFNKAGVYGAGTITQASPCYALLRGSGSSTNMTGKDAVVAVKPANNGTLSVTLTPQNPVDLALVVVSDCTDINDNTCLGAVDSWQNPPLETLTNMPVEGGKTYYIIVDTYNGSYVNCNSGCNFDLTITLNYQ